MAPQRHITTAKHNHQPRTNNQKTPDFKLTKPTVASKYFCSKLEFVPDLEQTNHAGNSLID
jgi:hypothetical protein